MGGVLIKDVLELERFYKRRRIAAVDVEDLPSTLAHTHPMRVALVDEDADLPMVTSPSQCPGQ